MKRSTPLRAFVILVVACSLAACKAATRPESGGAWGVDCACPDPWPIMRYSPSGRLYYAKPPPYPYSLDYLDADGRWVHRSTACDTAGGWIQRNTVMER